MNYRSSETKVCTECHKTYTRSEYDTHAKWKDRQTCGNLMCKEERNRRLVRERRIQVKIRINLIHSKLPGR